MKQGHHTGFSPDEWQQIYKEAKGETFLNYAVTVLPAFSGLTANAMGHLRDDWITWREDHVKIDIPAKAPPNSYKSKGGTFSNGWPALPGIEERLEPCNHCKSDFWDGNEFEHQRGSAQVILHHDIARPAVDILRNVFKTHGRTEIAVTPRSIREAANRVLAERVEEVSPYTKLKRTGPAIYAHYGLSTDEMADILPYSAHTIEQTVRGTPGVSISEDTTTVELLKEVSEAEPVTAPELADKFDNYATNVRDRLKRLAEVGRVRGYNTGHGGPTATWETTSRWTEPIKCSDCEFTTWEIRALGVHRGHKHK